jgi:hypothetical protein
MARRRNPAQVGALLVVEDRDVGEAGRVVDGDVDELLIRRPCWPSSRLDGGVRAGRAGRNAWRACLQQTTERS